MATDYYDLLGVRQDASADDIKRAYRRRARDLHPDANPDDPGAESDFKELARAYEVLGDPERRRRYDTFGPEGVDGAAADPFGGPSGGLGDIFDAFFGGASPFGGGRNGARSGPPRGADLETVARLDFEEAVFGTESEVTVHTAVPCETCEATGATPGSTPSRCTECDGAGQVRRVRQSILGQMVSAAPCPRCGGIGEIIASPCTDCGGEGRQVRDKTYTVDIPAGVDRGSTLRLTGRGAAGPRGGGVGDLYVHVDVAPHDRFERDGYDLSHQLHVSAFQAMLGVQLDFETLDGIEHLVVPRGTQSGRTFRLRGRGVPHVEGRGRGDLMLHMVVDTPTDLSPEQEDAVRRLAELRGEPVAPPDAGLLGKIRSAFK